MTKEVKIILIVSVVVVLGGVGLFLAQPKQAEPGKPVDSKSLVRDTSHMTGNKDAKVSVVEFGDFECPACAAAEPIIEQLRTDYKDNKDVNFVFRNFPLPQHTKALISAEAAEAAGEQGKFWEMHDKIYANQESWVNSNSHEAMFEQYARDLGLDVGKFKESLQSNKFNSVIAADKADGESLGVNSTPTIYINGEKAEGFGPDVLKSAIEAKLK